MLKYDSKGWEFYSSWVLMLLVLSCLSPLQFARELHGSGACLQLTVWLYEEAKGSKGVQGHEEGT